MQCGCVPKPLPIDRETNSKLDVIFAVGPSRKYTSLRHSGEAVADAYLRAITTEDGRALYAQIAGGAPATVGQA